MEAAELPGEWEVSRRQCGGAKEEPGEGEEGAAKGKRKVEASEAPRKRSGAKPAPPVAGPLGPRGVFDGPPPVGQERGRLRDLVLASLEQETHDAEEGCDIDVECLLCKVPYKRMLSDLFGSDGKDVIRTPHIPYVTRAYEESYMREVMQAGERPCAKGKQCECMFIDQEMPFVGVEFLLPGERMPPTPHLCVLCCRAVTQQLYYDVMFDKQASESPRVVRGGVGVRAVVRVVGAARRRRHCAHRRSSSASSSGRAAAAAGVARRRHRPHSRSSSPAACAASSSASRALHASASQRATSAISAQANARSAAVSAA